MDRPRSRSPIALPAFVAAALGAGTAFASSSLRFHGTGTGDADRVKVAIDAPANSAAGPTADVGAGDFTIEFWMKASAADDPAPAVTCGSNVAWRNGHVVVHRDRFGLDRKLGVSIAGGSVVFGVSGDGTGDRTICGSRDVLDSRWHHVAVERRRSDGWMWLYVDGILDVEGDGPDGEVSYPDDAAPAAPDDPFLTFGAGKQDEDFVLHPSYDGLLDEIRVSTVLRYTSGFTRPRSPFIADADTAALDHLDEDAGDSIGHASGAAGGASVGEDKVGGSPAGPEWSTDAAPLAGNPAITFTLVTGGVSQPLQVTSPPGDSARLFIVSQGGTIRIVKNGSLLGTPFLDIGALTSDGSEQGLLSMAFDPHYATNGFFYVYYTNNIATPGDVTLARYHVSGNPDVADPASAAIVLVVPHPTNSNHNGGHLMFSPNDGYLYMGTGDGGSGGDPPNNAQNKDVLLGKLLRLDVGGTGAVPCGQSSPRPYAIPPSNPFVGAAGCDEVWAYGLRNPWRWTFDRATGDLIIGDVGQNLWEEIDFTPASSTGGENYGWRRMEGFHCYDPSSACDDGTLTLPILEYDHTQGCSVTGGFRYRGAAIPALYGTYLYGDLCTGRIWLAVQAGNGSWTSSQSIDSNYTISGWGEDSAGELYLADYNGSVYKLTPTPNSSPDVSGLVPAAVIAGDPAFDLEVDGSGFVDGSVVRWNGADRPTTFASPTKLTAAIPAADIVAAGSALVTVFSPAPGGGTSSSRKVDINPTFLDVPLDYFAFAYIQTVFDAGVTGGCGARIYCPASVTTRGQMAVFLLRASEGPAYLPPPCSGAIFGDVPCTGIFDSWIEDLASRGITSGCGGGNYCPSSPVTRAQMAVLLLRTDGGVAYVPPACSGTVFNDVPCTGGVFDPWIEALASRGITGGCGGGNYCPSSSVTRAQMAVFVVKTFGL